MLTQIRISRKSILFTLAGVGLGIAAAAWWFIRSPEARTHTADLNASTNSSSATDSIYPDSNAPLWWQPFAGASALDFDSLLSPDDQSLADPLGPCTIDDRGDRLVVEIEAPHLDEGSLEIEVEQDMLHVSGRQEVVNERRDASGQVYSMRRSSSSYSRSFSLPEPVKPDGMTSRYDDDVLRIELPKVSAGA